jgi:hypothetical protein
MDFTRHSEKLNITSKESSHNVAEIHHDNE